MQFSYSLGAPRVITIKGVEVNIESFDVVATLDKANRKTFLVVLSNPAVGPLPIWEGDDYDTQAGGAGFTQAEIEARLNALYPAT